MIHFIVIEITELFQDLESPEVSIGVMAESGSGLLRQFRDLGKSEE